jgi:hypothetical protein
MRQQSYGRTSRVSAPYRAKALATLSQSVVYHGDRFPRRICQDFVTSSAANLNATVVILNEQDYDAWLQAPVSASRDFLRLFPADNLVAE